MATKSPSVKLMKKPTAAAAAETATEEKVAVPVKTTTKLKTASKAKPAQAEPVAASETTHEAPASSDLIVTTAFEIENLKEEKAFKLVPELLDNIDRDGFRLGGVLSKVQGEGWFMNAGAETFKAWVESACGIQYRKAMYLINIYNCLVQSGIPYEKVKGIGWTKLKELAPILDTENVDDWVALANEMTVLQLIEQIKAATKGSDDGGNTEEGKAPSDITTITFKLHKDQKDTVRAALDKAKHQTGSDVDTVALEAICMDYLGKAGTKKPASLKELMGKKDPSDILGVFNELYPNIYIQAQVFDSAEEAQQAQAASEAAEAEEAEQAAG